MSKFLVRCKVFEETGNDTTRFLVRRILHNFPRVIRRFQYLVFSGGQYIDLEITPTNHMTEIQYYVPTYVNDGHILGTSAGASYYHFTEYANKYYWGRNPGEGSGGSWTSAVHTLKYNAESTYKVMLDNNTLGSGYSIGSSSSLWIGKRDSSANFKGYIYYCKVYDKSTGDMVRDLFPSVDDDGVYCLYDNVQKRYYYNSGSGSFTVGPEIQG